MNRVESLEQYNCLTKEIKAQNGKVLTNMAFYKEEIVYLIGCNRLFYHKINTGLLFFDKRLNYLQMYFILISNMDIILDNFISQVCTDLPGRIGSKNTSEDIFLNCGFKKTGQFLRLRIDATVCDFSDCIGEFEYANECDAEEILQLWKNHLQRGNMIPNSFELIHDIAEKRILCIRIGSILASVLRVDLDDKTALIELVVTNPAFRRQGYGKKLLKEAIRFSVNQGFRNCVAWVEQKNSASLGMFETVGFCPDGRVVDKLFLE